MVAELERRIDALEAMRAPIMTPDNLFASLVPISRSLPFWESDRRFMAICAGVRSGKTFIATRKVLKRIFRDRGVKVGKLHYWCVAPTYDLSDVQKEYIEEALYDAGIDTDYNAQKRRMTLPGDITIWFKSTVKPKTLRARGVDGMWIDEAAAVDEDTWVSRLYSRLTDKRGWAMMTSTPEGENWFFKWCLKAPEFDSRNYPNVEKDSDVFFSTWFTADNEAIPGIKEEVAKARSLLPPWVFCREYEASFEAFKGQVYKEFNRGVHVVQPHQFPTGFKEIRCGVDWGFSDPGCILVWGKDYDSNWWCIHEQYHTGIFVDHAKVERTWVKIALEIQNNYHPWLWLCDPSEPAYISSFAQYGLRAVKADNDIAPGILRVATLMHHDAEHDIKPRVFIGSNCPNLIREILTYRYPDDGGEIPIDKDNHALDPMRYALNYGSDREVTVTR